MRLKLRKADERDNLSLRLCASAVILLACTVLSLGCSHRQPYFRDGQPQLVPGVEAAAVDHRLLLVGDAGDPNPEGEPTLELLRQQVERLPERTTVVFLGDNIYERGMPAPIEREESGADPVVEEAAEVVAEVADEAAAVANEALIDVFDSRREAESHIDAQIDVVRGTAARAIFIPGNHDWDFFELGGWERILHQQDYVEQMALRPDADVSFLPRGGCPGPRSLRLGRYGKLIVLDTQWLLETRLDGKPTAENNPTDCRFTTEIDVADALREEVEVAAEEGRWAIVAAHHPLMSNGPHGGYFDLWTHFFPLHMLGEILPFYFEWIPMPGLGSLMVGVRSCCSPSPQDMAHARNRFMREAILDAMMQSAANGTPPLLYVAGHDHSLQLFAAEHGPRYVAVSGLGSSAQASAVGSNAHTLFAHANAEQPGVMRVDFLADGAVRLAVIERWADGPNEIEVYSRFLTDRE